MPIRRVGNSGRPGIHYRVWVLPSPSHLIVAWEVTRYT